MKQKFLWRQAICLLLTALLVTGCTFGQSGDSSHPTEEDPEEPDTARFLVAVEDEPDTVDFQCTTIHYTVATNVFNRLVEMVTSPQGGVTIKPSLAEAWEISDDGLRYTFHLREGVTFSNGSPLTASDVRYTFTRLLTHPESNNQDLVGCILGAEALRNREADRLEGFELLGDLDFAVTLEQPVQTFLACLSTPGASILDEETTRQAGDRFGQDPAWTVGTGSFILYRWTPGEGMLLKANPNCFEGPPNCEGLDLRFLTEPEDIRQLFLKGEIDVLDLDEVGESAEYFIHGDIYQDRLLAVPRIAITYIALNENIAPLNDVRVRKALQLALNRAALLDAVYSGRGTVENGIYPHGLYGFNEDLPEIPYDLDQARALLAAAGYADGFDLTVSVKSTSTQWEVVLMRLAVSMWEKLGVRAELQIIDEAEFMRLRKSGGLACYTAMWTADFNDPDNFISTFFGSTQLTRFRSLCYNREQIMARVRQARLILDPEDRLQEYRDLERIIVQEDAAWIPLFSRLHYYVVSERVQGVQYAWNGSVKNMYREVTILD